MKNIKTRILGAISLLGLCSLIPLSSYADFGIAHITNYSPKPWVVLSNGQSYTKFNHLGMVTVVGRLKYDAGTAGRVKSWSTYPVLTNGYGIASQVPGLNAYKVSKSYSVGSRPKKVDKIIPFSIPAYKVGPSAVSMCNWQANNLRKQGLSNKQIFSKDREVTFTASMKASVSANGAGSNKAIWEASWPKTIKVRCAKWAGAKFPTAGGFTTSLKVIKATMKHKMIVGLNGVCKVRLTTAISTNKPNATVKFRYKSQSGKRSRIFTTKTKGNKIAVVTHTWNVTNGPSVFDGTWIHMAGVSPKFKSNTVAAFAECKKGGPSGLKPNPKKPTVNPIFKRPGSMAVPRR
jgi:hypothetical protein